MSTESESGTEAEPTGAAIEPTNVQSSAEVAEADRSKQPAPGETNAAPAEVPPERSGRIVDVIADVMTFMLVIARLATAAVAMRLLSQSVKGAYKYVVDCAETVDRCADLAAALDVDDLVTSSHHDAAAQMRGCLELADALADEAAEMSTEFDNAARDHESDYGDVNEAMQTGEYDIAQREWYSNR